MNTYGASIGKEVKEIGTFCQENYVIIKNKNMNENQNNENAEQQPFDLDSVSGSFCLISYKQAVDFLLPRHYSGRKPSITFSFGYFENNELKAVCTFGKPASNSLCIGVCGKEYSEKVFELNRLCVDGKIEIQLSKFVAWCLTELKAKDLILVSYADTQMNHNGYIYQATNWIYTGMTKSRTDKYVEGGKHSRHYDNENQNGLRKYRSAKHRYIYFATSKIKRKEYMKKLNYQIEPYPKGENKKYELGTFIEPIVISTEAS